jgi:hypothetical protein
MIMTDESRQTLELFLEKAIKLSQGNFAKRIAEDGLKLHVTIVVGQPIQVEQVAPDAEATDALAVTLRFFIQDNERISLRKLQSVLADTGVSQEWKDRYSNARNELNRLLDSPHPLVELLTDDGRKFTRREILDTFMYGEIAHAKEQKRIQYQKWQNLGPGFVNVRFVFNHTVVDILGTVWFIAQATDCELNGLPIPAV